MRSLLAAVAAAVLLVACSGSSSTTSAPLESTCTGAFVCKGDSASTTPTQLTKASDGTCHAGKLTLADTTGSDAGTKNHVLDSSGAVVGTWEGDSSSFQICADDGCLTCTPSFPDAADAGAPSSSGGKCWGYTSCSHWGSYSCSSHHGCYSYSGGYKDECRGTGPDCSAQTTKEDCYREDCSWDK